jgi:hypothetical protein
LCNNPPLPHSRRAAASAAKDVDERQLFPAFGTLDKAVRQKNDTRQRGKKVSRSFALVIEKKRPLPHTPFVRHANQDKGSKKDDGNDNDSLAKLVRVCGAL